MGDLKKEKGERNKEDGRLRSLPPERYWLIALLLFLVLLTGRPTYAQTPNYKSPTGLPAALTATFAKADLLTALSGLTWRPGLCAAATPLRVGGHRDLALALRAGRSYAVVGSAATGGYDLDLYLRDPDGAVILADTARDDTPVLEFTAPADGRYLLQLALTAGPTPTTTAALVVLTDEGVPLSRLAFTSLTEGFFAAAAGMDRWRWAEPAAGWPLLGAMVPAGGGVTLTELPLAAGPNLLAAAGEREARRIDLYLADAAGRIVVGTEGPGAYPVLRYEVPRPATYDLRIEQPRGRGREATFVLLGQLRR